MAARLAYDGRMAKYAKLRQLGQATALPASPDQYKLINIDNRSQRLLITEGRHSVIWSGNAVSLPDSQRDPSRALRRFHGNTMNLLFYDGHVENFGGKDSELQPYFP